MIKQQLDIDFPQVIANFVAKLHESTIVSSLQWRYKVELKATNWKEN